MPTINSEDAGDHACPYNRFQPCLGMKCMAWIWIGRAFDSCETDNLVDTEDGQRPLGAPPMPEGDGWEADGGPFKKGYARSSKDKLPAATGQRWTRKRKVNHGRCGRAAMDSAYDDQIPF
jgi:hypothetical protein